MKKILLATLLFASFVANAESAQDNNKTVKRLGVSGNTAHLDFKEGMKLTCKWGVIYFDISSDFGKTAYSTILAAKSSGNVLSRVDYIQGEDERCSLSLVEVAY